MPEKITLTELAELGPGVPIGFNYSGILGDFAVLGFLNSMDSKHVRIGRESTLNPVLSATGVFANASYKISRINEDSLLYYGTGDPSAFRRPSF